MHTIMIVGAGLALLALFLVSARVVGGSLRKAALAFVPMWFVGAGINVWIGVTQAGYTLVQELPVFLLTFAVPAAVAWLISRRVA